MKYLNFILTVIALLLAIQIFIKISPVNSANARSEITNVNIEKIAGRTLYNKVLAVKIEE